MGFMSFPEQIQSSVISLCGLFQSCLQHYALHCNTEGHFSQIIFGADLVRIHRFPLASHGQLISKQLVAFDERCGTYVKTLTFFLRDFLSDRSFCQMNIHERRLFLSNIYQTFVLMEYPITGKHLTSREDIDVEFFVGHILNTLPREIFDRKGVYHQLLSRLIHRMYPLDNPTGRSLAHFQIISIEWMIIFSTIINYLSLLWVHRSTNLV